MRTLTKQANRQEEEQLANEVAAILNDRGYEVYLVGGIVRDQLLGKEGSDYDLVTSADFNEIATIMKEEGYRVAPQERFRIVLVYDKTPHSPTHIDVAQYRVDVNPTGRKTDTEEAETLEEDLARRDFTINAIAKDMSTGKIIDPYGGAEDLQNKILRTVGNPYQRFKEDYLRILRGLRFAARYDLAIDPETAKAMTELAYKIPEINKETQRANVSSERVMMELIKTIEKRNLSKFVELAKDLNILKFIGLGSIEELSEVDQPREYHPEGDVLAHTLMVLQELEKMENVDSDTMLAALFHDVGKKVTKEFDPEKGRLVFNQHAKVGAEIAEQILRELKFPNETIKNVKDLVNKHMVLHQTVSNKTLKKLYSLFGDKIDQLVNLAHADSVGRGREPDQDDIEKLQKYKDIIQEIKDAPPPLKPLISGKDVMQILDLKAGPQIGIVLKHIMEKQLDNEINSEEEALQYVKDHKEQLKTLDKTALRKRSEMSGLMTDQYPHNVEYPSQGLPHHTFETGLGFQMHPGNLNWGPYSGGDNINYEDFNDEKGIPEQFKEQYDELVQKYIQLLKIDTPEARDKAKQLKDEMRSFSIQLRKSKSLFQQIKENAIEKNYDKVLYTILKEHKLPPMIIDDCKIQEHLASLTEEEKLCFVHRLAHKVLEADTAQPLKGKCPESGKTKYVSISDLVQHDFKAKCPEGWRKLKKLRPVTITKYKKKKEK